MDILRNEVEKTEELFKRHEVKDTPFTIVELDGEFFAVLGKFRLTEPKESFEDAVEEVTAFTWNRIIQVMMLVNEQMKEHNLEKLVEENEN